MKCARMATIIIDVIALQFTFEGRTCQHTSILPLFDELGLLFHALFLVPSYSLDSSPITNEMSIN